MRTMLKATIMAVVLGSLQLGYALIVEAEPFFYGATPPAHVRYDVTIYHVHASRIVVRGEIPYRDFRVEYPPLALPVFLVPRLFTDRLEAYRRAFQVEIFAANALAIGLVVWWIDRKGRKGDLGRRLAFYTIALALLCPMAASRFDLVVAAWTLAAVITLALDRPVLGGWLAGLGVWLKVGPGVVALPALAEGTKAPRVALGYGLAVVLGLAGWLAVSRDGLARMIAYHSERGIEIESLYTSILMTMARAKGQPIVVHSLIRSVEVETA